MVRNILFWVILVPLAIVIVMFAAANRHPVTVSFDPFHATEPAGSVTLPLFVLVFVLVILGVILGGVAAWLRQSGYRRAARMRDADVAALRREVETLNRQLATHQDAPISGSASRLSYRPSSH